MAYGVLSAWNADWISFALLTLVPMIVPVGFIFIVGQAGMLLDVRALKASYGRVVAGFALGSVAGGLSGAPLLGLIGATAGLLVAATLAVVAFLVLVEVTRHRYPAELSVVEHVEPTVARPTLRTLARNRFVVLVVAFQMLSAVESQWLDFHVFSTAAARYDSSDALARFVSEFSAVAYGADILFLLLIAGWLLRRFGLRFGLTANAIGVLLLVAAVIVTTALLGSGATSVFVLIVAARVTDLTLSDGASRTSLSAAYQAVPGPLRGFAQASVEGLAVPIAIGASGVVLLAIDAFGGSSALLLPILTAVVVSAWVVVAILTYRAYRVSLLASLRGRALDPADLTVDDEAGLLAIERLVASPDERDVRLGLDILTIAQHPRLADRLQDLAEDDRVGVRTDALERLVQVAPRIAADAARSGLSATHPDVRAAAIRVLGSAGDPADRVAIDAHWDDPAPEVRVAVAFALSRMDDESVRTELASRIGALADSDRDELRLVAARMLAVVDPAAPIDRAALRDLLGDGCPEVVDAALDALREPEDRNLLPLVVERLDGRHHRRAAVDALVRAGDAALELVDAALREPAPEPHVQEVLVRVAREVGQRDRGDGAALARGASRPRGGARGDASARGRRRARRRGDGCERRHPHRRGRSRRPGARDTRRAGARGARVRSGRHAAHRRARRRARPARGARARGVRSRAGHRAVRACRVPTRAARPRVPTRSRWSGSTSRSSDATGPWSRSWSRTRRQRDRLQALSRWYPVAP